MRYDEDDLVDYGDQDDLSYDESIDEVTSHFKGRVSASVAEAMLEKFDWDVDLTISKLEAQQAQQTQQTQQTQKKSQALKPAQKISNVTPQLSSVGAGNPQKTTKANEGQNDSKGKLSRLQLLAQRHTKSGNASHSIPQERQVGEMMDDNETKEPPKGLARLASRRSTRQDSPSETETTPSSALERLRSRMGTKITERKPKNLSPIMSTASSAAKTSSYSRTSPNDPDSEPEISYVYQHLPEPKPSDIGQVLSETEVTSHSFHESVSNAVPVASIARDKFSNPSPDELVLAAQSQAFGSSGEAKSVAKSVAKPVGKSAANQSPSKLPTPASSALAPKQAKPIVKTEDIAGKLTRLNISEGKPHVSFVVIGHVDAGKSTLMGRMLLDTGAVSKKLVDKYARDSAKEGKASFALAWVLDATEEERRRGVTVDIGEAQFETASHQFTVVDAPGHKDYVPNMIAGVSQADVALLVVDSAPAAFESGFSLDGQTKEHAILARALGIDSCIVAVNKLDLQDWSQSRYDEITGQLQQFLLKELGFAKIAFVPTSGKDGVNVVNAPSPDSILSKWYKGPTLVGVLSEISVKPHDLNRPFVFLVSNAYIEPYQSLTTVAGRVLTGVVEVGDDIQPIAATENQVTKVKSVACGNDDTKSYLMAGQVARLKADFSESLRPGDVIAAAGADLTAVNTFTARIRLFDVSRPVLVGTRLVLYMGRVDRSVRVVKIKEGLDKYGKPTAKKLRHIGKGGAARVELELDAPAVLVSPSKCRDLGKFVLRINGTTVGGGVVE